jgi:putative glycosyltransferase (TIGR04348 family)
MKILLVSPVPRESTLGNATTARRWERIFVDLGHEVEMLESWDGEPGDVLVALHARRSHDSVVDFAKAHPGKPRIVALTGTDLYLDLPDNAEARESLRTATRLVLLQEHGRGYLPTQDRDKAVAILQSAVAPARSPRKSSEGFDVCVLAHLREVKDPLLAAQASRLLPEESRIRILHAGKGIEDGYAEQARREMEENPRYHWLGELDPDAAKERLAGCRALVLSSRMEGGANVISEAVVSDVPVLTTRISGSLGMLGEDYPGYFEVGDARGLAQLLLHVETDPGFVDELLAAAESLRTSLHPEAERESWKQLLAEIESHQEETAG